MQKIRLHDETEFELISATLEKQTLRGYYREIVKLAVKNMTYQQAIQYFTDGATWVIIDHDGTEFAWNGYGVAGSITDNRDNTVTSVMGKNNTVEQDLQDAVNTANESVKILAGKEVGSSAEAAEIRKQIEDTYTTAATDMDDDEKIINKNLAPEWKAGRHIVGEVFCTHSGNGLGPEWEQLWKVCQEYNNSIYPDIKPGSSAWLTFNIPYHGTTPETALPFVPGQPAHAIYHVGEYMIFTDGYIYKCKQDTTYSPSEYDDAWEKVSA